MGKFFVYNGKCEYKSEDDKKKKNRYEKNYCILLDKIKNIKNSEENQFFDYKAFIETILKKVCLLPIQTKTLDSAMEIFETLNDRGLQLSDADIFKAKIYGSLNGNVKEQQEFVETWNEYLEMIKSAIADKKRTN